MFLIFEIITFYYFKQKNMPEYTARSPHPIYDKYILQYIIGKEFETFVSTNMFFEIFIFSL